MTPQQEQQLFSTLRTLKKEVGELKEMLKPYTPVQDEFLNAGQAMKELKVKQTKLYLMLSNGELPFATKIGHQWRFSKKGIDNYLRNTKS